MDVSRFEIGVSEAGAAWAVQWLEAKARERKARLGEIREGLGRLQFVAGPLEHIRPFLGPLYAWCCAGPRHARPSLPVMILLILRFLAVEISRRRTSPCRARSLEMGEIFRIDAKAEGEEVAIGGWRTCGNSPTSQAQWFAVRLNRRNAPWAFARGEAFRTIASLELRGILVGIMVLMPAQLGDAGVLGSVSFTCGTDNQGNSFLLDKLMTTKYPLGVVLMEVACQLGLRNATLRANWLPRLQNEEADALTNSDFRHFSVARRNPVKLEELRFVVLTDLFQTGDAYVTELEALKAQAKRTRETSAPVPAKRSKKPVPLREKDPW